LKPFFPRFEIVEQAHTRATGRSRKPPKAIQYSTWRSRIRHDTQPHDYGIIMARHDQYRNGPYTSTADSLWHWAMGPGRKTATRVALRIADRIKQNLAPRRLFSFPHLLVACWFVVLLWGERWVFETKVDSCDWDHWEKWVSCPCTIPAEGCYDNVPFRCPP
jgi:hypothetical protein